MSAEYTEIWSQGKRCTHLSAVDRGLQYGDGLFETVRVRAGKPLWLQRHLQRLNAGCLRLSIPLDGAWLEQRIHHVLARAESPLGTLKIVVTRGVGERGYRPPLHPIPTVLFSIAESTSVDAERYKTGVKARLCRQRLGLNPQLAGIKHLNRLEQVCARSEWNDPEVFEGLMLDTSSSLVEATSANLFLVRDGELLTPLLDRCGVQGVMRQVVMEELAPALGLLCREQRLGLDDLYGAQELLLTNSLIGVLPVRGVDCFVVGTGSVGQRLIHALEAAQNA